MTQHTQGDWRVDEYGLSVSATDEKGYMKICDIRGWGHLTGQGSGALGLNKEDAIEVQKANARLIAAAKGEQS